MTVAQFEERLLCLAGEFRTKAKAIEDKWQAMNKGQTDVAVAAIVTCASDLEDEVTAFRRSRPKVAP